MVAVVAQCFVPGFDDQRAVKPLVRLGTGMGVIPVRSRIRHPEPVGEALAGHYRVLGEVRAIHGVFDRKTVPVHQRGLRQVVEDGHVEDVAFGDTDLRSRHAVAISPRRGLAASKIQIKLLQPQRLPDVTARRPIWEHACGRREETGASQGQEPAPRRHFTTNSLSMPSMTCGVPLPRLWNELVPRGTKQTM